MNDLHLVDQYLKQNQGIKYDIIDSNFTLIVQNPNLFRTSSCEICIMTPILHISQTNSVTSCCLVIDSDKTIQLFIYGIASTDKKDTLLESIHQVLHRLYINHIVLMDISLEKYFNDYSVFIRASSTIPSILYTYEALQNILNEADTELLNMYVHSKLTEVDFLHRLSNSTVKNQLEQNQEKWIHRPNLMDYQTLSLEKISIQIPYSVELISQCINSCSLFHLCLNLTNLMIKGYSTLLKKKCKKTTLKTLERKHVINKEEAFKLSNYVLDFLLNENENHLSRQIYYPSGMVPNWDLISKRLADYNQMQPALKLSDFPKEAHRYFCSTGILEKIDPPDKKGAFNIQTVLKTINTIEWDANTQKLFDQMINEIKHYGKKKSKVFTHPSRRSRQNFS